MFDFWYDVHVTCAVLSVGGFVLRGTWMMLDHPLRRARLVRVLPHLVDTLLLVAALTLAALTAQWPFAVPWLTAKLLALLLYIGFGLIALRFGRTPFERATAFGAALVCVAYIVAVALTRQVLPFVPS